MWCKSRTSYYSNNSILTVKHVVPDNQEKAGDYWSDSSRLERQLPGQGGQFGNPNHFPKEEETLNKHCQIQKIQQELKSLKKQHKYANEEQNPPLAGLQVKHDLALPLK